MRAEQDEANASWVCLVQRQQVYWSRYRAVPNENLVGRCEIRFSEIDAARIE